MTTVHDIMILEPCQPTDDDQDIGYPEHRAHELFGDRHEVALLEICDEERVPIWDRQRVLHRLLPEPVVHEAECRYAEHALQRERMLGREPDPRSWAAIEARRAWLREDISDDELHDAYYAAAAAVDDAADDAYWAAAAAAYSAAATATTRLAYRAGVAAARAADSASDTELRWQLRTLRRMIVNNTPGPTTPSGE